MIRGESLSKSFNGVRAIDNLDFEVREKEIFGIVGPDGAGKSTLLRMLSTILVPDSGDILLHGESIFKNPFSVKERIAYMPQRFGLYEDLSVEENIRFFGRLFGLGEKEIREQLPGLYEFSNLGQFSDRLAGNLSGGMKQKLGLACCLVHRPELILLDEPTNGVDPVSRREFWKILYTLLGEGVTIIVSTAYLDEAERCSRVGLMYQGEFINIDTPAKVKTMTGMPLLEIQTDNPNLAEDILKKRKKFSRLVRTGQSLRIFAEDRKAFTSEIKKVLSDKKINVKSIREITPGLEDTFVEVIARGGVG
ncbi:MAG: ABC transporter ATP-binding protein [Spirochaetota bacterium]